LLPASRIQVRINGNTAAPVWLGTEDHMWLRALIDDFARLDGKRYRDAVSFLQEPPRVPSPSGKRLMAIWMLQNMCARQRPLFDAGKLRAVIALEAQRARDMGRFNRADVITATAAMVGISAAETDEHMFSDLPMERRLILPDTIPDPHSLAAKTNLALSQGLLNVASDVTIELYGGARAVVRQVHLQRLLCTVERVKAEGVRLHISGAFSLFRHTTMYGHALASILTLLSWCERFDLIARCMLRRREVSVHLCAGDPIAHDQPPRKYDSRIEERFAHEFASASLDWDLVREPEPIETCGTLVFPDFAIVHRRDTSKRFLLEIVGFWTPGYLREKLDRLRHLPDTPLVLCINRALNCGSEEMPAHARIVWFQKRIEPGDVLAAIERAGVSPRNPSGNPELVFRKSLPY
jgi:predicted nuclease of restriction endonuclease-like RecB superfamily